MLLIVAVVLTVFVLPLPLGAAVVGVALLAEAVGKLCWVRLSKQGEVLVGIETMIGSSAKAISPCMPRGQVKVASELWQARALADVRAGDRVRIRGRDGLTLLIEPEA